MQIAEARQKAEKFLNANLQRSRQPRPAKDERVLVRYPQPNSPTVLAASSEIELREKLAKRIQATARRKSQ